MCIFSEYKDIFGAPGTGIHSYRAFDIAIVDVAFTIILIIILVITTDNSPMCIATFCFGTGIIAHRLFCVRTTIDRVLFP
jgi:hypothetical protein